MPTKSPLSFDGVHCFLKTLFADGLHVKRVLSLAGATLGVIESASLAVARIAQGVAMVRRRLVKHAIKQVARLSDHDVCSNEQGLAYEGNSAQALEPVLHWLTPHGGGEGIRRN